MMNGNWLHQGQHGFGNGRGIYGNGSSWLGGGFRMLVGLVIVALIIYLIWRISHRRRQNIQAFHNFQQAAQVKNFSTSELEEELAKRKQAQSMEAEVADLKKQLEELKKKNEETL